MKFLGSKDAQIEANYRLEKRNDITIVRKTGRQTFIVMGDTLADTEADAVTTAGIPPLYYPGAGMYVVAHRAREVSTVKNPITGQDAILFEVDVDYDSQVLPDDNQPPTAKPPRVRWTSETTDELLERDAITGKPVVTANNEPILITHPVTIPVLEITRYEQYPFDPDTILAYGFRTNSAVFWGAPPSTALMMPMDADEELIDNTRYAVVTYRIKFHPTDVPNPWNARPLHYGTLYRATPGGPILQHRETGGYPTPTNLKMDGTKLGDNDPPVFLDFARHRTANFNALSLGPFGGGPPQP